MRVRAAWAHARRKFIQAQQAAPAGKPSHKTQQVLSWIGKLYALEKQWLLLDPEDKRQHRQEQSKPILDQIESWLTRQNVNPQSLLGRAIHYLQGEWQRLNVYLEDGWLNIDNNLVKNAIRPFTLGRKNCLFSQSVAGAHASAALYSLVETARAKKLNTYTYLKHLFTALPQVSLSDDLDQLLPWNIESALLDQYLSPVRK